MYMCITVSRACARGDEYKKEKKKKKNSFTQKLLSAQQQQICIRMVEIELCNRT